MAICRRNGLAPVALALVAASIVAACIGAPATAALRYEREALAAGQLWRLLTAHVVHLSPAHLCLNTVGLGLATMLLGPGWRASQWTVLALISGLGVSAGLWFFDPHVSWYVGLSGMAHGLVAAGAIAHGPRSRRTCTAWLLGLSAKLAWERMHGPLAASADWLGGTTVIDAHLYGALAGLTAAMCMSVFQQALQRKV